MDLVDELSQKWMPQNPSDDKSTLMNMISHAYACHSVIINNSAMSTEIDACLCECCGHHWDVTPYVQGTLY